jgi:hypothetical protein
LPGEEASRKGEDEASLAPGFDFRLTKRTETIVPNSADDIYQRLAERARELQVSDGFPPGRAFDFAWLEERVRLWPPAWGDSLQILIYGDFKAPEKPISYDSLRITIYPEKQENTIILGALTVLRATVAVDEKSVAGIVDAVRRINVLLGIYTLNEWGNGGCGWWSWVIHGTSARVSPDPFDDKLEPLLASFLGIRGDVRKKLESAMFWVRYPRGLVLESYRDDTLRGFAAYWNAFECLVDAVNLAKPMPSLSRAEKQKRIDEFFKQRGGELTAKNIQDCFRQIIDQGLRPKAKHALEVCFGEKTAELYMAECFDAPDGNALYAIRNAINHGDIDAENPHELIRVGDRMSRLWMIVWKMFACLIPFPGPVDTKLAAKSEPRREN